MAMIKNAAMFFIKCDPKRPDGKYNKANPSWECQLRTSDPEQRDLWKKMNLNVRLLTKKSEEDGDDDGDDAVKVPLLDENGKKQWRVNLKKGSIKKDKTPADPVKVINGQLEDVDPNTIANGSIGNIRVFQYEYKLEDGKEGIASMLMAIQVTRHIVYVPKPREDDFDTTETEVIHQAPAGASPDDYDGDDAAPAAKTGTPADQRPADAF